MDESLVPTPHEWHPNPWYGTVRSVGQTCRWCTEPTGGLESCRHCRHHRRIPGVADVVAPVSYAISGTTSAALVRDYKNHPSRTVRRQCSGELASLLRTALALHEGCLERAAGRPIDLRATIPSLTLRSGVHPFAQLVHAVIEVEEGLLVAGPLVDCHRAVNAGKFMVDHTEAVAGRHVLILDDLWTTGSNAQSAALALRAAGAAAVSVLVIARWLNPSYPPTKAFLTGHPAGFNAHRCPVIGAECRPVSST